MKNSRYENKLSNVEKSIQSWVTHALTHEKKNENFLLCNDIAQIMSEIFGISKIYIKNFLIMKESLL